jgi:hypothetical protein
MRRRGFIAGLILFSLLAGRSPAQTTISLPLTTGDVGKIDLGFFAGGTVLQISATGSGDVVNSSYQTNPDGSLAAPATGSYTFADPGAVYPSVSGFPAGNGFNDFVGGGSNYDFSGSGWMFAGLQTTDTTNPAAIRSGAVVGTFASSPARNDWFLIGDGGIFTVPSGGADFFVAVNDSVSGDNHGSYSLTFAAIPEPSSAALGLSLVLGAAAIFLRQSDQRAVPRIWAETLSSPPHSFRAAGRR